MGIRQEQPDKLVTGEVPPNCDSDLPKALTLPPSTPSVAQTMPLSSAITFLIAVMLVTGILYYFRYHDRFQNAPLSKGLLVLFQLTIFDVSLGLIFGGLVGLSTWIASLVRSTARSPHIVRRITYVTAVMSVFTTIAQLNHGDLTHRPISDLTIKAPYISQHSDNFPQQKARMAEIMMHVLSEDDFLTPAIHREFWGIFTNGDSLSPEDLMAYRNSIADIMTRSQRSFWDDALIALKIGHAFKSVERENIEKDLVRQGVIPEWRVQQNEKVIELISSHKPVELNGESIVFTEELIELIASQVEPAEHRIRQLFSPPGS